MKTKILNYLKNNPESPQTKVSVLLGISYYKLLKLLNEMEENNLVIKTTKSNATYWSAK